MNDIKLEPCPFCGGEGEIESAKGKTVMFWRIHCCKCGASTQLMSNFDDDGEKMVVNSWNWESKRISARKGR